MITLILVLYALTAAAIITGMGIERKDRVLTISGFLVIHIIGMVILSINLIPTTPSPDPVERVFAIQEEPFPVKHNAQVWREDNEVRIIILKPDEL